MPFKRSGKESQRMSVKRERRYHSPQREEQVNATRRSILAAAEQLFAENGFAAVTMQRVASEADVSLATVYLYFPGKAAMVAAMAGAIVASPDLSVEQVEQETDPVAQLRLGSNIMRRLNDRSWLVADILRSAHGMDETLARAWDLWQQRHMHAIDRTVRAVQARRALREGLSALEATDVLYSLAGTEVYRILVRERSWSPERYEQWLFELACRELLGISPGEAPDTSS
jgi:AcrR family transcriptional regulator